MSSYINIWNSFLYRLKRSVMIAIFLWIAISPQTALTEETDALYTDKNGVYKKDLVTNKHNTQYNLNGQQAIKNNQINLIPSSLIKSPKENASAILVEKNSQTLWVYRAINGYFTKVLEIPCSTGEVDGPKMVEGDKKTPEGIYFLKDIYEDRFLTPIYGSRAFTTDYPNFLDKTLGKTGSAIWIHGTNKTLKPMDSNGCIAMNNDDIVKLDSYVVLDQTPVIIMDKFDYSSIERTDADRSAFMDFLSKWIESLNKGSYLDYLFHYESNYMPDVQWWAEWVNIRYRAELSKNPIYAQFDNVGIYRHKDHFVVLLNFQVASSYRRIFIGNRKLFIKSINNVSSFYRYNSYKIIGDVFQSVQTKLSDKDSNHFIAAAYQLEEQYREYKIK
ncbi:MAG: murein L,D-transpeptidase family protein [Desulfamplus sp.]